MRKYGRKRMRKSNHLFLITVALLIFISNLSLADANKDKVTIREEKITLPTYLTGEPCIFPIFYNGRAYQGAQGRVYPYPFLDELTDKKENRAYHAVCLENEYIELCILPDLGGRIFSARDKTNNYDLFYRQSVVKPALIGMLGAWLSGGVEWNIPHHHRATAFLPVDYTTQNNSDGSKTIWIGELELRHRTSWAIGLTLYPGKSLIETKVRIINRTPYPHSMLYWANVAVHTSENYQVIFPPSTQYATYHGKNQFADWPIARQFYHNVDYSSGIDISWWKNLPAATSFFAWNYEEDYLAGYDHGKKAGIIHIADHHIMPGKKFWTWGTGDRGKRWETILSDSDGPYLEIMVGAYSDNQPDYSWIKPYEIRTVTHYWYPLREIQGVKAANLKAAVNLEIPSPGNLFLGVNVSSPAPEATLLLMHRGDSLFQAKVDLAPDCPFSTNLKIPETIREEELALILKTGKAELIRYNPKKRNPETMPQPVKPPMAPKEISSCEELYLTGLRLEQFHNPSIDPIPYYEEALRRDPLYSQANIQMGTQYLKKGMFEEAEKYLRSALERLTFNHTKPKEGDAYYYLGLALREQTKTKEAVDVFNAAAWDIFWQPAAYYNLAEMECAAGNYQEALELLEKSPAGDNFAYAKYSNLKTALFRRLGRIDKAEKTALESLRFNPLDFWAANELYLIDLLNNKGRDSEAGLKNLSILMRDEVQSYLELSLDYMNCGLYKEAKDVLLRIAKTTGSSHPLIHYYLGYLTKNLGEKEKAETYYLKAPQLSPDLCFPFRIETEMALRRAFGQNPQDSLACYLLGNCLFESRPKKAITYWEKAEDLGETYFMLFRNLSLAYAWIKNDIDKAVTAMEKALSLNKNHARLFYELDTLYEASKKDPEERLILLEDNFDVVKKRDDALTQNIKLLVQTGNYDRAIKLMLDHHFHLWEGGGQIHDFYVHAHILRGCRYFEHGHYNQALKDFKQASDYPYNLEVARPVHGGREAQVQYFVGTALEALGKIQEAQEAFRIASADSRGWSELSFYKALSMKKTGFVQEADKILNELIKYAQQRITQGGAQDFFTKFGEKQSAEAQTAQSNYLLGLGEYGLNRMDKAFQAFSRAVELNPNHFWARYYLKKCRKNS